MPTLTVTEALAEIKTLGNRIKKRRENVMPYLVRQRAISDPLADQIDGGSTEFIKRELQAVDDMQERLVRLRVAIQSLNQREQISVDGETRTIAAWLTWRKEVLPGYQQYLATIRARLDAARREAATKNIGVVNVEVTTQAKYSDLLVNISEIKLAADIEHLELVLGTLDGQLSLKNATTTIEV